MRAGRGGGMGGGDARKWVRDGLERHGRPGCSTTNGQRANAALISPESSRCSNLSSGCSHRKPLPCSTSPVTEEPPIYPPNPHIERAPQLDDAAANAVLTYRLLTNHWRTAECCVVEKETKLEGRYYSSLSAAGAYDLDAQKDAIVSYCGGEFFPTELLQNRFLRVPRGAGRGAAGDSKRHRLKEMEQKENENKGTEEKAGAGPTDANAEEELFGADEQDDFGGDDYAHDYYADEDIDDNVDDGDDGGIL